MTTVVSMVNLFYHDHTVMTDYKVVVTFDLLRFFFGRLDTVDMLRLHYEESKKKV